MAVEVDTYRVRRRQDMGGRRFREADELLPEAHLFFAADHWLHVGAVEQVKVSAGEFRAAVEKHCPEQAEAIYAAVGLAEGAVLEGPHSTPRSAPMNPGHLPARANQNTVTSVRRAGGGHGSVRNESSVSIRSTDRPDTAHAPVAGDGESLLPEEPMVLVHRTEGVQGVYEDASTTDPAALNEALTGTRPEDIERHNADAAYEAADAVREGFGPGTTVTGVAENPVADPIGTTETGAVGPGVTGPQAAAANTGSEESPDGLTDEQRASAGLPTPAIPADHLDANPALRGEGGPTPE